jgi:SPP1 gp7 family putative phage head morphogenesis protein
MLIFKVRRRRSPMASPALTNSQRRIVKIVSSAMDEVRAGTIANEGKILDALQHSTADKVLSLVPVEPWLAIQEPIQEELLAELRDAGAAVKVTPMEKATIRYSFDGARPEAAAWAAKEAGLLIREITEEQRALIRGFLSRSQMGEMDVRQVARQLRDVVGLTSQQAVWVENHRNTRISELMTDKGMTFDQAFEASDASTARYQARVHKMRAETIARTETLRAARQGQKQSYSQARAEGFMRFTVLEWSTAEDDRVCEICGPLNGLQIPMDGQFPGVDDWTDGAHINCRCEAVPVDLPPDGDLATLSDADLFAEMERLIEEKPL